MRVWDCYAQDWMPDSPVLLRFESDDVLVLPDRRVLIGPVLTEKSFEESMPEEVHAYVDMESIGAEDKCLCWNSDQIARGNIGDYMSVGEALALELEKS